MDEIYRFDVSSYESLLMAGIAWQSVLEVLRSRPQVRHHLGAVLRVGGRTADGEWLGVALIEEHDDEYLVVSARRLDRDEIESISKMIEGGAP